MKQEERSGNSNHHALMLLLLGFIISTATGWLHAEETMSLTLSSTAFAHGDEIPSKHTCEAEDLSPPLHWEGVPEKAESLVLIVDDPDAPDPKAPKTTWVHWVLYNLPSGIDGLSEGTTFRDLPNGAKEGLNDWIRSGYDGPCPPIGRHRYFFKLYALDRSLAFRDYPTKAEVEAAMQGHVIERCELVGTYKKAKR
ncbi:YbhB/YbcL family Raf kinase inhibitor-like protein [Sulfurimonas sp. HSL3-7]|uniref:YbhB/YbcL family Raf kinase inhibitor-like protein n=1 Tax=Sulfonitrofixus jiaomeiensis TaxID=3131938 RepID=UPI0031F89993